MSTKDPRSVDTEAGTSRARHFLQGEIQPTLVRDSIKDADTPEGQQGLVQEILRDRLVCQDVEATAVADGRAKEALRPLLAQNETWCYAKERIGARWIGLGVRWGERSFLRALAAFDDAILFERARDEVRWALAHNDKGAAHYWYAVCLAGGDDRLLLEPPAIEVARSCIDQMRLALRHYDKSWEVRGGLYYTEDFVLEQGRAQTLQNNGTAKTHLALWTGDIRLVQEALGELGFVRSETERAAFIKEAFPTIQEDLDDAALVYAHLIAVSDTCYPDTEVVIKEGVERISKELGEGRNIETGATPNSDFSAASLGDLVKAFVPEVPQAAIARLDSLLCAAQAAAPANEQAFVHDVNRILDAHHLRLKVEGQSRLARLTFKEGLIRLSISGRGQQVFSGKRLSIVCVPSDYGARKPKVLTNGLD